MSDKIQLPYEGHILLTSPYGYRILNGEPEWHKGLDLVSQGDKVIRAAGDGVVIYSTIVTDYNDSTWGWGNFVCVHIGFYYVYCCHMDRRLVSKGQVVKAGDPIGIEGNTGNSFGAHCHYEVRDGTGTAVDPFPLLGLPQSLNKSGTTLYNTFKEPEPEPDTGDDEEMTGEEIYKKLTEYLVSLPESKWSKDEGSFERMKELGIMDGKNPRAFLTREQDAATKSRTIDMIMKMVDERLANR